MESHANTSLPDDIMVQIFLLLPLDSILSCKLVSKEWNRLVKHPTLTKLYTIESMTFFLSKNGLVCLLRRDDNNSYKVCRIPNEPNKHRNIWCSELLRESSNKIACVKEGDNTFLLYNLITGDSYVVADAPFCRNSCTFWLCYGFGYDCYEDDYKIMLVCRQPSGVSLSYYHHEWTRFGLSTQVNSANSSMIFVYSNRTRKWKLLQGFPSAPRSWRSCLAQAYFLRGVLHWVVTKIDPLQSESERVVAVVDIHSYGYGEIRLPPGYYDGSSWMRKYETLAELDGNLCYSYYCRSTFEVWVMKEYGVSDSWTKLFSIHRSQIKTPLYQLSLCMTTTAVFQCRDARKIVVFFCYNSGLELFQYDIDKGRIDRYEIDTDKIDRNGIGDQVLPKWRAILQRLKTRLNKACCFLGD